MNVTLHVQRCSFPTSIHSTNPTRQNPPGSENGPQQPIRSPSGPSTTRTPRPWPKRPTDDPNDPLTAPTRLHPKQPTYDPSALPVPSTQGVDSRACTTSAATPAILTRSMCVRRDEEVRREGKGKEMEGAKEGEGKTRRDEGPTSDRQRDSRRQTACPPRPHPSHPQDPSPAPRTRQTLCIDARHQQPGMHRKRRHPSSVNAQHEHTEDEETREGKAMRRQGRQCAHHVHETPARQTPYVDTMRRQPVCTASAAIPAIDAQHEHTERRRGEEGRER
ncbi:hypothetical protein PAXINDRAFT_21090 [Paxillus involutus ATCC 200175]|uniref:Uncharacterized protein n=1 Tax=Paxillus involutus ATCC 200175 TaxID=664439 RepID=A0A0C9TBY0_PAXIN|nr:hypothetical protein PAXINDRAFT_21090 [Paxillus involutus ATCC 200175]